MPAHCTVNIVGQKIGRLQIVSEAPRKGKYLRYMHCLCDCGNTKIVKMSHLVSGKIQSCGCLHSERSRARVGNMHKANITHGLSQEKVFGIWFGMKQRCGNPRNKYYSYYGGRGIKVCKKWSDNLSNFIEDMGLPPEGMTIDRINGDGNYEPSNCRWATRKEQQNNLRSNRIIEHEGVKMNLSQWAEKMSIHRNTLSERLDSGWSIKEALETPVLRRK